MILGLAPHDSEAIHVTLSNLTPSACTEADYDKVEMLYRHLQIERAYVDIGPFKKIYQREYLWNHTYHIPKY